MTKVKARFDGRVFVPETPVDLPVGYELEIPLSSPPSQNGGAGKPALVELLEILTSYAPNPHWPADGAAQNEHYLYGTPKRP